MRRWTVSLAAAALASLVSIGTGVAPAGAAGFDPLPFQVQTADVTIPGAGVSLDGLVYRPVGAAPSGGFPLVVFPASWSAPKQEYEAVARELAARGYLGVAYTLRGFFGSTGEIMGAGAEDQADLSALITWATKTLPVDPARIGTFGVSYGAGIGLLGASADPRIRAVVALSGWMDLQSSLLPGNTIAAEGADLLKGAAQITGRPSQLLLNAFGARNTGNVDPVLPLAETRSPGRRIGQINANGAAIMVGNGWQDSLFPASQFFSGWDQLTVPKKLMLAPGDHAIAEASGIAGLDNDYVDAGEAWLDHWLMGKANGADTQGRVLVRPTLGGSWTSLSSTAALTTTTTRQYLGTPSPVFSSGSSLTATAPGPWSATWTGGSDSSATAGPIMLSGIQYAAGAPPSSVLALIDRSKGAVWQTAPLRSAVTLGGRSAVRLNVTPSASTATVIAYLYDVDGLGRGTLLSWQPWTGKGLTAGKAVPATIALEPVFQKVAAGHRLALAVDSYDERYRSETTSGQKVTVGGSTASPSYVDLALR